MKIVKQHQHGPIQYVKFGSALWAKPSMFVYVYYLDGLLIDTGHRNMRKEIVASLSSFPVEQIFLTHHHEDHTGNCCPLETHFGCPLYASSQCAEIMKNPPAISFAQWQQWGKSDATNTIIPKDDFINTTNYHLELIPIPGHARDMVCLYEKNEGWLFSADLWVYQYIKIFMRPESMSQQIESIKKIIKLDFDILFCSHNPQLTNGKELLKQKLNFLEDFYGKVVSLHKKGLSEKAIFKAMQLSEKWSVLILTGGALSTMNMVRSVIRDESRQSKLELE